MRPEITQVIFEPKRMLEIGSCALLNVKYRFDIVWDRQMLDFVWDYFREGIKLAEKQAKERGVRFRLITEVTKENLEHINSLRHHEIRHVNSIRTNFPIIDETSYMVQIFHIKKMNLLFKPSLAILGYWHKVSNNCLTNYGIFLLHHPLD